MSTQPPDGRPEDAAATTTVARAIARVLEEGGVRRIYTVPGESALELFDVVGHESPVEIVSNRHESGSSFMAEAEGKLTGTPAVAIAGRGVGATNLSIGVFAARHDSTPMLAIVGQVESDVLGTEAFQEVDLVAFFTPIAKRAVQASAPERVPELVAEGLRLARSGRPGPVVVIVPTDYFAARIPEAPTPPTRSAVPPAPDVATIERIGAELRAAKAPVAIAGGGAAAARPRLVAFAERFGVGVYTAFRRQDVFPNDHPLHLGHLGVGAGAEVLAALDEADLVLSLGTRLSEVTSQGYRYPRPGVAHVHVDVDPATVARVGADVGLVADLGAALDRLVQLEPPAAPRDWTEAHARYLEFSDPSVGGAESTNGVHPTAVVAALSDVLPADTIVASDAGNYAAFLHRYRRYTAPRSQLAPTSGSMGYAVPAAVAAALAAPRRTVVAVVGDGGFLMTAAELETAVRCGLRLICVVFRNGLYGTIATHQLRMFERTTAVQIGTVDLATYARGLGCEGIVVDHADDLRAALQAAVASACPTVIDVRTDPNVLTPTVEARLERVASA